MKLVILAAAFALIAGGAQAASCNVLQAQANQAIADANNADGICNQARGLAYALRLAAQYNKYCVNGGGAQAQEDYAAAQQADQTAAASCS